MAAPFRSPWPVGRGSVTTFPGSLRDGPSKTSKLIQRDANLEKPQYRDLVAALAAQVRTSANLSIVINLVASLSAQASLAASLSKVLGLQSNLAAQASLAASLGRVSSLQAAITSQLVFGGALSKVTELSAALASQSGLTASLSKVVDLAAELEANSSLSAEIFLADLSSLYLDAAISISSTLEAELSGTVDLSADITITSYFGASSSADLLLQSYLVVKTLFTAGIFSADYLPEVGMEEFLLLANDQLHPTVSNNYALVKERTLQGSLYGKLTYEALLIALQGSPTIIWEDLPVEFRSAFQLAAEEAIAAQRGWA